MHSDFASTFDTIKDFPLAKWNYNELINKGSCRPCVIPCKDPKCGHITKRGGQSPITSIFLGSETLERGGLEAEPSVPSHRLQQAWGPGLGSSGQHSFLSPASLRPSWASVEVGSAGSQVPVAPAA